jgi:hypothetical protein
MSGRTASTGAMEVSGRSTAASPRAAAAGPWRRSEEAGDALDRAGPPRRVLRLPLALVLLALPPLGRALPVASAAAAAPDRHYRYGNPTSVPCQPGEVNMTIKGVPGIFCSPPCSASRACPSLGNATIAPPGVNYPAPPKQLQQYVVKAECAIEQKEGTKATFCAMVCDPTSPMKRSGCPGGPLHPLFVATCQTVETIGICTYSKSAGPPSPPSPSIAYRLSPRISEPRGTVVRRNGGST